MRQVSPQKKQQIVTTAEKLVANGIEQPTNDQVREGMGGGSIADISPVMREWREQRKKTTSTLLEMPDSLKNTAIRFSAELWRVADGEAQKEIESIRQDISEQLTIVTDERDEALQEIIKLEGKITTQDKSFSNLKIELDAEKEASKERNQSVQTLTIERDTAKALLGSAEKRANEIAETLKTVQTQQTELQKELIALAKQNKKASSKK